jgi:hypothetical protein
MCPAVVGTIFDWLYHLLGVTGSILAIGFTVLVFKAANNSGKAFLVFVAMVLGGLYFLLRTFCSPNVPGQAFDAHAQTVQREYANCLVTAIRDAGGTGGAGLGQCSRKFKYASPEWFTCVQPVAIEASQYGATMCQSKFGPQMVHP